MRRILIATEGSDVSHEAIRHFTDLLKAGPVEIAILSVITRAGLPDGHPTAAEHYHRQAEHAQETLDRALHDLETAGFKAHGLIRVGEPAEAIVEVALEFEAELIVLGTHARAGLNRVFRGSVAESVLRHAPCGVYIYPHVATVQHREALKQAAC